MSGTHAGDGGILLAFTYPLAYLVVTSARDAIDNPLPMPEQRHGFAGTLT